MEGKRFITENTKIKIDEEAFKVRAQELISELFVEYVNNLYNTNVVELKR